MPAPFPYAAVVDSIELRTAATQFVFNYDQMCNQAHWAVAGARIDLKAVAQLRLMCQQFVARMAQRSPEQDTNFSLSLFGTFSDTGHRWKDEADMVSQLVGIAAEADTMQAYIEESVPEARVFADVTFNDKNVMVDVPRKLDKATAQSQALIDRIATFRALFD